MKSRHCDEGSNLIIKVNIRDVIASFVAMTERQQKLRAKTIKTTINILICNSLNQTIPHRAQLGVYLRLLDIPVPATYGSSADDISF